MTNDRLSPSSGGATAVASATATGTGPSPADSPTVSRETQRLVRVLQYHDVDVVLDVGANIGQYAQRLRRGGYTGRIVSFEPLGKAHLALEEAARGDPGWQVAPRIALGDSDQPVMLNISAESDMSSVLGFTPDMARLLDSSAYVGTEIASQSRLEAVFAKYVHPGERVALKVDTQGTEHRVLDGAKGVIGRLAVIQTELAIVPVYQGEPDYRAMIDRLDDLGFVPILFIPGYFNRRTARLIGMDGVFARAGDGA